MTVGLFVRKNNILFESALQKKQSPLQLSFLAERSKDESPRNFFFVNPFVHCVCASVFFLSGFSSPWQEPHHENDCWQHKIRLLSKVKKLKPWKFLHSPHIIKTSTVRVWAWPFREQFVGEGKIVCWLQSATDRMPLRKDAVKSVSVWLCCWTQLNSQRAALSVIELGVFEHCLHDLHFCLQKQNENVGIICLNKQQTKKTRWINAKVHTCFFLRLISLLWWLSLFVFFWTTFFACFDSLPENRHSLFFWFLCPQDTTSQQTSSLTFFWKICRRFKCCLPFFNCSSDCWTAISCCVFDFLSPQLILKIRSLITNTSKKQFEKIGATQLCLVVKCFFLFLSPTLSTFQNVTTKRMRWIIHETNQLFSSKLKRDKKPIALTFCWS